jgi:thiamine biosynthesis lipoprotein
MGSALLLTAYTSDEGTANAAFDAAIAEFDRLDRLLSVWKEGSEVQRLNAAAGKHPVPVGAEVRQLLAVARQVSEWTGGAFDVTVGALAGLWKFDHDQDDRIPAPGDIARQVGLVDFRALRIDEGGGTVRLAKEGMRVHVGGIGKGYALDRASAIVRRHGLRDFMIQAGGDLVVAGRRGDRAWRVGIRDPRGAEDQSFAALDLQDEALSTSGDYERFFLREGRRYHHILDPKRGAPADASRSVTILTSRSVLADALSTGVFVLGPAQGMALIERLPGVEGVIVSGRNEVLVSSGLRDRVIARAPPTDAP